jgi:heme/copper-type cytochrome/quinol oxidase subunit 2
MDDEYRLAWYVVSELILIGLVTLFLTVATVWIVWYVAKTVDPDEIKHLQFFLIFIVVIVPFIMLFYCGSFILICDALTALPWRTELPSRPRPLAVLASAVIYISLTIWLWLRWRKS